MWTLATASGLALTGWIVIAVPILLFVSGPLAGALTGILQRSVLKQHGLSSKKWLAMNIIAWTIGMSVFGCPTVYSPGFEILGDALRLVSLLVCDGLLIGAIIGLGQRSELQALSAYGNRWIFSNAAALAISFGAGSLLFSAISEVIDHSSIAHGEWAPFTTAIFAFGVSLAVIPPIIGIIYGLITGFVLGRFVQQHELESDQTVQVKMH